MEPYKAKMYEFFTSEENFLNMCKVAKNYPEVKKQLETEFWDLVYKNLGEILKSKNNQYVLKLTGKISDPKTKILLYKINWPNENDIPVISIAIQRLAANDRPFYGPWINRDSKNYDVNKMFLICKNQKLPDFAQDDDKFFPFFKFIDINFREDEEYTKILPDKRDSFATMIAEQLYDLAILLETNLDELSKTTT